ncbi:MAG TPA: YbaB/EbfC family nucleoid-associated protein [Myxococcales bacterium]|nr:YbaB/EbfC family nucleoid-associated protein [Myxococcales bacterium]
MSTPDMNEMLKQAQRVQERMAELQRDLVSRRYEASSGGGMATAVVSGQLRVLELHIEPTLVSGGDRSMIEDLAIAAINAALEKAQASVQQELQQLQGSMMMPGPGDRG